MPKSGNSFGKCGLKGIVVAGVLAASFSTFDSIGSTLSSLLVRDVYARLLVRHRNDHHYLRVGQLLTPIIIFGSFAYIPFMKYGMVLFYLDIVGAFVVPLLTIYLMGIFTPAHRVSGSIALFVGVGYGVLRLMAPMIAEKFSVAILPPIFVNSYASYPIGVLITAGTMVVVSLVAGWQPRDELMFKESDGWLRSNKAQIREIGSAQPGSQTSNMPLILGLLTIAVGLFLSFVIFW